MNGAFAIGERVAIPGAEADGYVRMMRWDGNELDYFVTWWESEKRFCEWLRADELRKAT